MVTDRPDSSYLRLLHNRTFVLLWSGETISSVGDALFNVAIMWVVYVRTGSALQTVLIQVIYTLTAVVLGPVAGVYADRWNRKWTMLGAALVSGGVTAAATLPIALGHFSPLLVYVTVFLLNAAFFLSGPARSSALPEIVGREQMMAARGLFSLINQGTSLLGVALAGTILALLGATWALVADAVSFLAAAAGVALAAIPGRAPRRSPEPPSLQRDLRDGWRVVQEQPVIRSFIWIAALVNVTSYMGPLFPVLVRQQLHGGVAAYAGLEAASVVGGITGGLVAGNLERRVGAGRLIATGFAVAGLCFAAIGISTSVLLSGALFVAAAFFLIASDVSTSALTPLLVPEEYRGRVLAIMRAFAVSAMPVTIILGGWLADQIGPGPLYLFGGLWAVGVGALAWSNPHLQAARIAA